MESRTPSPVLRTPTWSETTQRAGRQPGPTLGKGAGIASAAPFRTQRDKRALRVLGQLLDRVLGDAEVAGRSLGDALHRVKPLLQVTELLCGGTSEVSLERRTRWRKGPGQTWSIRSTRPADWVRTARQTRSASAFPASARRAAWLGALSLATWFK